MTCKCGSNRILELYGKSNDCCNWNIPHLNQGGEGYAPDIQSICANDDIEFSVCLDCGQIQNFNPISDEELRKTLCMEELDPLYDPILGY